MNEKLSEEPSISIKPTNRIEEGDKIGQQIIEIFRGLKEWSMKRESQKIYPEGYEINPEIYSLGYKDGVHHTLGYHVEEPDEKIQQSPEYCEGFWDGYNFARKD